MDSLAQAITNFFNQGTADLGRFVGALTLIGTATMALIQTAKDVTPIRQWFQRHRLRKWLREGAASGQKRHQELVEGPPGALSAEALGAIAGGINIKAVEEDIVRLSVDGDADALYDLTIEQMCGQLNAAFQMVIDYPVEHLPLLLVAASEANTDDIRAIVSFQRSQFDAPNDSPGVAQARVRYADARNRVAHQLQRAVDGFQIAAGFRWKWSMQIASFVISAGITFAALYLASSRTDVHATYPITTVLITAVLAGFFAPVARDITAALQKLRT